MRYIIYQIYLSLTAGDSGKNMNPTVINIARCFQILVQLVMHTYSTTVFRTTIIINQNYAIGNYD